MDSTKVAIHDGTVIAAAGDTIYHWKKPEENIAIGFEEAKNPIKLDGFIITCLKTFEGRILVGTECGTLIIISLSPTGEVSKKRYKISFESITSIRLFKEKTKITATICSNQDTFKEGELKENILVNQKKYKRDHLVQDARRVESDGSYTLHTVGRKKGRLYRQDGKMKTSSPIFDGEDPTPRIEVIDISEQGSILMHDGETDIHLRQVSNKSIKVKGSIGNSCKNVSGVGVIIPDHFALYAGSKYPELAIASFEPGKAKFFDVWGWQGYDGEECFSSIDYDNDQVVLGRPRSIIIFNTGFIKPQSMLRKALKKQGFSDDDTSEGEESDELPTGDAKDIEKSISEPSEDQGDILDSEESASKSRKNQGKIPDSEESKYEGEISDSEESVSELRKDRGKIPDSEESKYESEISDSEESISELRKDRGKIPDSEESKYESEISDSEESISGLRKEPKYESEISDSEESKYEGEISDSEKSEDQGEIPDIEECEDQGEISDSEESASESEED